jgi:hypothetical protein
MNKEKSVCFAYFGDNKFVGWYSDTFGTVTKNSPKVYQYSEKQVEIVAKNFRYNMSKLAEKSELAVRTGQVGLSPLDNGINSTRKGLGQYENVELRVVDCPYYEGENPNYDKEKAKRYKEEQELKLGKLWHKEVPFEEEGNKSWVYCDYAKVKDWALNEPTEFSQVLTSK